MSSTPVTRTLLVAGLGLVTCVTETTQAEPGALELTILRSAVDEKGRRVELSMWRRIERVLGAS